MIFLFDLQQILKEQPLQTVHKSMGIFLVQILVGPILRALNTHSTWSTPEFAPLWVPLF